jgi:hypothetical protein
MIDKAVRAVKTAYQERELNVVTKSLPFKDLVSFVKCLFSLQRHVMVTLNWDSFAKKRYLTGDLVSRNSTAHICPLI